MLLVHEDKKKRIIKNQEEIKFSSSTSYHLIILTARAKDEKQIVESSTDDEELTLEIDGKIFSKLNHNPKQVLNSPAAINGSRIHNLSKTIYFLTNLDGKDHKIILKTDTPPGTATFESLEIYIVTSTDTLTIEPKIQAEDGDRREWITFVLDKIPLQDVVVTITYSRRKRDSDDVKIRIDGQIQGNILRDIKHFLWYFAGSLIPIIHPTKTESQTFMTNFSSGLHYIEIDADRMPILENEYTFQKVRDPLSNTSENRLLQWRDSFEVAAGILSGRLSDTTSGATNFHSFKDTKDFPSWATEETYRAKWSDIYFYELEK